MKKIQAIPVYSLIILGLCVGCAQTNKNVEVSAEVIQPKVEYIDIKVNEQVVFGPYEPDEGIYLGSYVENNTILDGDIDYYEDLIGQDQAFRVFQYVTPGDIGQVDLLECIANKQTPYIKILPNEVFDLMPIYHLVGDLTTSYKMPVFVELLPVTNDINHPQAYKEYYQEAYQLLKKYLPEAVIVWGIDLERAEEAVLYYPGDHMVDWVGMNIYLPKYKEGEVYTLDVEQKIDLMYKSFQDKKPLMISTLAISHFSRVDHTYTIEDTKNKLKFFYEDVPSEYPRIKGILYADIDMKQIRDDGLDDYRLTSHEELITKINSLQDDNHFLHQLTRESIEQGNQLLVYTLPVIEYEESYYIAEHYLDQITSTFLFSDVKVITDDISNKYYELSSLINT